MYSISPAVYSEISLLGFSFALKKSIYSFFLVIFFLKFNPDGYFSLFILLKVVYFFNQISWSSGNVLDCTVDREVCGSNPTVHWPNVIFS